MGGLASGMAGGFAGRGLGWLPEENFPGVTAVWDAGRSVHTITSSPQIDQVNGLRRVASPVNLTSASGLRPDKVAPNGYHAWSFVEANLDKFTTGARMDAPLTGQNDGLMSVVFSMTGTPTGVAVDTQTYNNNTLMGDDGGWATIAVSNNGGSPNTQFYCFDAASAVKGFKIATTTAARHIALWRMTGGTLYGSIDGGAETPLSITTGLHSGYASRILRVGVGTGTKFFNGDIHAAMVANSNGALEDRLRLISHYKTRWGI